MRKARIVLSIVFIVGLTAGMLAWRAKRKFMPLIYYTCNTYWVTCTMTWTIGGNMNSIYDPNATLTVHNASMFPNAFNQGCVPWCTWSNTVYIEPGF